MRLNPFEVRLNTGPVVGLWVNEPSPQHVEMVGRAGFDFACFDLEHRLGGLAMSSEQVQTMRYAAAASHIYSLLRVPNGRMESIAQYVQTGVDALVVPQVSTVEQAQEAYRSTRFPPDGNMGISGQQVANGLGFEGWVPVFLIPQLETVEAEGNLNELLEIPEIVMWFIGPADFAMSCRAQNSNVTQQEIDRRIAEMAAKVKGAGKKVGIMQPNPAAAEVLISSGEYDMVALGSTTAMIKNALVAAKAHFTAV